MPALVAVFPEDIFFGMNRDVLSPLLAAAALIMLVGVVGDRPEKYRLSGYRFLPRWTCFLGGGFQLRALRRPGRSPLGVD